MTTEIAKIDPLQIKTDLAHQAVATYMDEGCSFTIASISKNIDINEVDFFDYFPHKTAALHHFYTSIPDRYRAMVSEIDGYENLTAGEKLANYIYTVFDMLQEQRDFVEETFDPFVFKTVRTSDFEYESRKLISEFLENDRQIPPFTQMALSLPVDRFLAYEMLHVIKFWLGDTSDGTERTSELVEKLTAFIDEVLHTAIADRGFDLAKFMVSNRIIPIPLIGRFLP